LKLSASEEENSCYGSREAHCSCAAIQWIDIVNVSHCICMKENALLNIIKRKLLISECDLFHFQQESDVICSQVHFVALTSGVAITSQSI
jgi:hypothetical protein